MKVGFISQAATFGALSTIPYAVTAMSATVATQISMQPQSVPQAGTPTPMQPMAPREENVVLPAAAADVVAASNQPFKSGTEVDMSDPVSREELTAKLDVISAQTDAKFERVLGEMRTASAQLLGRMDTLSAEVGAAKDAAVDAGQAAKQTRWQVFFMVIGALGTAVAVAALVYANTQHITGLIQAVTAVPHK
jgi:hypothetical protein